MKRIAIPFLFLGFALLAACSSRTPAPVTEARPPAVSQKPVDKPGEPSAAAEAPKAVEGRTHVIARGETLISIALQYGLDYRELAAWNNIENPNVIKVGDQLRLTAPGSEPAAAPAVPKPGEPVATPLVATPAPPSPPSNTDKFKVDPKAVKLPYSDAAYAKLAAEGAAPAAVPAAPTAPVPATPAAVPASGDPDWAWPVKGKLLSTFTDVNKGIDIAGTRNAPVLAAAAGKVIYNQSGLRGYGRLVIIKHSDTWLSAYAHNEKVLVMEGQSIKKGEKIAEMGSSDTDTVKLHFEIRKQGKPVDPMKFLPAQ